MSRKTEHAPCGRCGAPTMARSTRADGILRYCEAKHGNVFRREPSGLVLVRTMLTQAERTRLTTKHGKPCIFPECTGIGRPRSSGLCYGHHKQRQRRGEENLRPLSARALQQDQAPRTEAEVAAAAAAIRAEREVRA